jgi:hypothetical protein
MYPVAHAVQVVPSAQIEHPVSAQGIAGTATQEPVVSTMNPESQVAQAVAVRQTAQLASEQVGGGVMGNVHKFVAKSNVCVY